MLKTATLTVSLLAAAPALAQPAPPAAPTQAAPTQTAAAGKENPLDKIVCRTEDTIGSRLKAHKVCATVREWKDQEDENRREFDRIQQGQGVTPSG